MDMTWVIIEFIFSLRWLWIIAILVAYNIADNIISLHEEKLVLERQKLIKDTDYSEEKILGHLDYIISECINEYALFNINTKNKYYISSNDEQEMIQWVAEKVPSRMSNILMTQLSYIYDSEAISDVIGTRVYASIVDYVLQHNLNNEPSNNEKE